MTACPPTRHPWHRGPMLGFDLETTGVNVEQDRIVTASIVIIEPGREPQTVTWLVDPGIEIPKQASDIHGITTAHAVEHGQPPHVAIDDVVTHLKTAIRTAMPIVTMNGVYDLTLLDRECRRHGITRLSDVVDRVAPVIDVLVLDKAMDKYRKGSRKLTALAAHYGIPLTEDDAHNSAADALAACRIAWKLAENYPALQIDPLTLHDTQTRWAGGQRASFAQHRQRTGQPLDPAETDGNWPIRPLKTLQETR